MSTTRFYETSTSGLNFDRFVEQLDESALLRLRQRYWTTKQLLRNKLGKKEDAHLLASDAEFDAKLAVFHSVRNTSEDLLSCLENYQLFLCDVIQEENGYGRFLKAQAKTDTSQAGKVMNFVGRAQTYSAHQRLAIRHPLVRFYQELHVFTERAITDCALTVEAAEKARTDYRGSLLWMKHCSEQLDPDTERQLDKFRAVQAAVRRNKARFDQLKLDTLQKIDILVASRCNLISQLMCKYQTALASFATQSQRAYKAVAENVQGYQYYEFEILKDLIEPSRKLAQRTNPKQMEKETTDIPSLIQDDDQGLIQLTGSTTRSDSLERLLFGRESPQMENSVDSPTRSRTESPLGIVEMDDLDGLSSLLDTGLSLVPSVQPVSLALDTRVPRLQPPPGWNPPLSTINIPQETTSSSDSFSQQWQKAFGLDQMASGDNVASHQQGFLPSQILHDALPQNVTFPNPFQTMDKTLPVEDKKDPNWDALMADFDPVRGVNGC